MRTAFLVGLIAMCLGSTLPGQEPVELTIHPRAIESPALKYRLFPPEAERKAGNAATILLRLPWEQSAYVSSDKYRNLDDWNALPLASPQWQDFRQSFYGIFYEEMKRAAYRREAAWEYPIGEEPLELILLPDVQGLRHFLGRGLSARIRYHLSRGELDLAREGILVGLANAKHMMATPLLVNQGVAAAIQRIMLDRVAELISQPDSPNLYWALSALPDPLVELDRAADLEGSAFLLTFAAAKDLDRPREPEEWKKMLAQWNELRAYTFSRDAIKEAEANQAAFLKLARAELPQLLKIPAEKVAAMSDEEAAIRWLVHMRTELDQREAAVLCLRPHEALPRLKQLRADVAAIREKVGRGRIELMELRDPMGTFVGFWSVDRKVQALRIIEAVRHHLATASDKLPPTLADIKDVTLPLDPLTDRPFEWKVEGNRATLAAPALPTDLVPPGPNGERRGFLEYQLQVP